MRELIIEKYELQKQSLQLENTNDRMCLCAHFFAVGNMLNTKYKLGINMNKEKVRLTQYAKTSG